ncbi:MAG: HAMP domain-containing histidine kinase, partial [Phycisphaerae bacterium]|nr:HAMP domain-containing histidine kinase [Phycisphaerae bacterium]
SRTGGTPGSGPKRGTGLGLSLVKHAAAALGGKVGLESVWGRGTTVWVEVPVEG